MDKQMFMAEASHLLELSVDKITRGGEGELTCEVMAKRENRAIERCGNPYLPKEGMGNH